MAERDRPLDVGDVVLLVGVDEDQVEGLPARLPCGQGVQRGPEDDLRSGRATPARSKLAPRDVGVGGLELEGDDTAPPDPTARARAMVL